MTTRCLSAVLPYCLLLAFSATGAAQAPAPLPRFLTIPYLANTTKPADLDFAAAQCDVSADGDQMTCRFRQLFITPTATDPATCAVTTNGYEQTFRRDAPTRWVSATAPAGDCGVIETTTLEDGGGMRWTMTVRESVSKGADTPVCRAAAAAAETYDWRTLKRTLPCTSIQPGAIER